jgi:hypothetical protein
MALEQVAGPFSIRKLDGTPITDFNFSPFKASYSDDIGLFAYSATMSGECIIQLDGIACLRCDNNRANTLTIDLQKPNGFLMQSSLFADKMYILNKTAMVYVLPAVVDTETTNYVNGIHVRCTDRYLQVVANRIETKPLDFSAAWTTECSLTRGISGSSVQSVCRTKKSNILMIGYSSGEILFYDHVLKQQLDLHLFTAACVGIWYSPRYDLYILAHADDTITIWSSAIAPASLSTITAETPLTKGRTSVVMTRLLGDRGEPCPGELVDWEIAGAVLVDTQTKTDSEGYARNVCVVSPALSILDSVQITASVTL